MSGESERARSRVRSATPSVPAGVQAPAALDKPPDGWTVVNPTLARRFEVQADRILLSATDSLAREISRRRFLKRLAQAGVVVGLSFGNVLWQEHPSRALPLECNCFGQGQAGPCGPSDICLNRPGFPGGSRP